MLSDCEIAGPLLPPGFVAHGLPLFLERQKLNAGPWPPVRDGLRAFAGTGGPVRVLNHVLRPLTRAFGYAGIVPDDGAYRLTTQGDGLRAWVLGPETGLDSAPGRGAAARLSPRRIASRALRGAGETMGLIVNGDALRLLFCDPAGPDSQIAVSLGGWRTCEDPPDSFRCIASLASPAGLAAMPALFDAARLHQTNVTKSLRTQARAAIEVFLRGMPDRLGEALPGRHGMGLPGRPGGALPDATVLWNQALTIVYRVLFIAKLESGGPEAGFGFASSAAWRRSLSPNRALADLARRRLDLGQDTGHLLEDGLRAAFRLCRDGLAHPALSVPALGGGLFDPEATAAIDGLAWGERAVALLLDRLLWTAPQGRERERVHYGSLDVEELGRVYEALLDLEPAIATQRMTRAHRGRLETVLPAADGEIPAGGFYLRSGLGRRGAGSYYTPRGFVRHLVRETLTPLVAEASPDAILAIKVFDPAMGSGHFLVEACRFLASALYDACARRNEGPDCLLPYLPAHAPDRAETGISRARALGICRRLVAVRCLYGIDRDARAVELAKVSLWLESFAEGLPLTFLDHRLVAGDSIGGPFFADLIRLPVGGGELDPLLARGVADRLTQAMARAMADARLLEASIGTSLADVLAKQAAKDRMDRVLRPLRLLARAWSGAAAGQARAANDAWLALAWAVAATGAWPDALDRDQAALMALGGSALALDLTFPEIFRPDEAGGGFHAVLGNPPWDVVHYQTREYLAGFDPAVMDAATKRERDAIELVLLRDKAIQDGFERYKQAFVERKNLCGRLFPRQGPAGSVDLFQVFAERMLDCMAPDGAIGIVLPSSIHANEGTAYLRRRLLSETRLETCYTFENRKKLFDIHGRLKFTLLTARRTGATASFRCGFYLDSVEQIGDPARAIVYDRAFVAATGGAHGTFLELRGPEDLRVARHMFLNRPDIGGWMAARGIVFGREAHMTGDSHRFTPAGRPGEGAEGAMPLHEGKTFHQYTDRWKAAPRYGIEPDAMRDKPGWMRAASHERLVFREIARSTDDRTMIAAMIAAGCVVGHKGTCERTPWNRPDRTALLLLALFNSFPFDWCVRQKTAASVSLFMLNACPVPDLTPETEAFLTRAALMLTCRHAGFDGLWRRAAGTIPRPEAVDHWHWRAAIDAAIARGYGLSRADYAHILGSFPHKAHPEAPERCLAAFDEPIAE